MAHVSDPSALTAAQHAARARRQAGDPAGAAAMLEDALEHFRPAFGEDHPHVLTAAHELARLHREVGAPAQSRRVLEEALAAGQRRLGDADPLMLAMSYDLGTVAEELGNRHEARRNFGRVATAGPAVLGQDHWAVRAARRYLGEDGPSSGTAHDASGRPGPASGTAHDASGRPGPASGTAHDASGRPGPAGAPPAMGRARLPVPADRWPGHPPADRQPAQAPADRQRPSAPYQEHAAHAYQQAGQAQPGAPPPRFGQPQGVLPPVPPEHAGPARAVAPQRRARGAVVAASVAAVAAVVAAVLAGIAVFGDDGGQQARISGAPTTPAVSVTGEPPRDVRVTRDGDALVLTWTDPAPGRASFVITGGQRGEELRFVGQVPSGATPRFPVHGFNPTLDYCFQVAAVYSTTELGVAQPVCTTGGASTPAE